jgi:hypothetical protein
MHLTVCCRFLIRCVGGGGTGLVIKSLPINTEPNISRDGYFYTDLENACSDDTGTVVSKLLTQTVFISESRLLLNADSHPDPSFSRLL